LRFVGGDIELVKGVIFYAIDRPSAFDVMVPTDTPWAQPADITQRGIAWVCRVEDQQCLSVARDQSVGAGVARETTVSLSRWYMGLAGRQSTYVIRIVRPQ